MIKHKFHIKRRVIISLLLTITITLLLNKFWLTINKSMPVTVELLGQDNVKIEIQLNKKNDNKFKKKRSEIKKTDLNKTSITKFNVEKSIFPKRLKLIITPETKKQILELKAVSFRNNKYKANKFEKYTATGANLKVKDNKLLITPTENSIELIYNEPLKIHSKIKFKFEEFIIIFVLTLLLMYKLTDYLADFNTLKKESRIEILFLAMFFIMLFIPMGNISQEKSCKFENRTLAPWKPLVKKDGELNYNFGKDYDKWFNDRFNLRLFLIKTYSYIQLSINDKNKKGIIDRKSEFLYNNWEFSFFSMEEIKKAFDNIQKFNKLCKDNNIKLYIWITPQKSIIHSPQKETLSQANQKRHQNFLEYTEELNKTKQLNIIYPYNALLEASKDNFMFFKTEHHWTDDGTFIGYKEIMQAIKRDYPSIEVLSENDYEYFYDKLVRGDWSREFSIGTSTGALALPNNLKHKYHSKTEYRYYKHKNFDSLYSDFINEKNKRNKIFKYPDAKNKLRVLMLGTSMNENLTEFIPFTFSEVKYIRINNIKGLPKEEWFKVIKHHNQEILEYKPDIILFGIIYNDIPKLDNFFNME